MFYLYYLYVCISFKLKNLKVLLIIECVFCVLIYNVHGFRNAKGLKKSGAQDICLVFLMERNYNLDRTFLLTQSF